MEKILEFTRREAVHKRADVGEARPMSDEEGGYFPLHGRRIGGIDRYSHECVKEFERDADTEKTPAGEGKVDNEFRRAPASIIGRDNFGRGGPSGNEAQE